MLSDYITPREENYVLSEESARDEVRRILDFYEIELDENAGEEEVKNTGDLLDELARYFRLGKLETREDPKKGFCVVQHVSGGTEITYRELKGKDLNVLEKFDRLHLRSAYRELLGLLSGYGTDVIEKLKGRDKSAALGLAILFSMA
jgi:hypothetical protein